MDGQSHAQLQASDIYDLRTALEFLSGIPGQLGATDVPVDPYLELAGVYRRVGSGTPVAPPTRVGPALHPRSIRRSRLGSIRCCAPKAPAARPSSTVLSRG